MNAFLAWMHGTAGPSAYDAAVANGFTGTVVEWIASLNGKPAYTFFDASQGSFLMPELNGIVMLTVKDTSWMAAGEPVWITGAGVLIVSSISNPTVMVLRNPGPLEGYPTGIPGNAAPGTTISAGPNKIITPSGRPGFNGIDGINGTNGTNGTNGINGNNGIPAYTYFNPSMVSLTMPVVGGTMTLPVMDASWMGINEWVYVEGVGYLRVTAKSGNSVTFRNPGAADGAGFAGGLAGNASPGAIVSNTGLLITPGGRPGADGAPGGPGGGGVSMFYVGNKVDQPLPTGSTSPTTIMFTDNATPYFNDGTFSGTVHTAGGSMLRTITLENLIIERSGPPAQAVNFTVAIMHDIGGGGVSIASTVVPFTTADTLKSFAVLAKQVLVPAGSTMWITVTPSVALTASWSVKKGASLRNG